MVMLAFQRSMLLADIRKVLTPLEARWGRRAVRTAIEVDQGPLLDEAHHVQLERRFRELVLRVPYERMQRDVSAHPLPVQDRRMMVNWTWWAESQWGRAQLPGAPLV